MTRRGVGLSNTGGDGMSSRPRASQDILDRFGAAYAGKHVVVTGGASFIGSHLTDALLECGAKVRVIDDFSSGLESNLTNHSNLEVIKFDLCESGGRDPLLTGADAVFHLAAIHGGRGFIDTHPGEILANLAIDHGVFRAARSANVPRVVHASSACIYPTTLQAEELNRGLLREQAAGFEKQGAAYPDGVYGWTKLIGELQLQHLDGNSGARFRSARIFTAYGERENESHAVVALIAKALLRLDPFPIWGSGNQTRNFTYVSDTVAGLMGLGADSVPTKYLAVNVGTPVHTRVIDLVETIFEILDWRPEEFVFDTSKPVGVASRAADNTLIRSVLGWEPSVSLREGLARTVTWYRSWPGRITSAEDLESRLMSR